MRVARSECTGRPPGDAAKYSVWRHAKDEEKFIRLGETVDTFYNDSDLASNKEYTYCVAAFVNNKWAPYFYMNGYVTVPVMKPVVTTTAGDKDITVTWTAVGGASKYRIRRSDGTGWTTLATVDGSTYVDTTAKPNVRYSYVVYPCVNGVFSNASDPVSAEIVLASTPILTVSAQANNVTVSWNSVAGATKYRIRRNDGTGWTTLQTSSKTSYVDNSAESGKRYTYVVYPFVNGAFSEPSQTVKVALVGGKSSANITVFTADGQVRISWDKIDGVKKYRVRRNDGTKWQTMASTANLSWTDSSVDSGSTYTYVVYTSTDGVTYSNNSSTITAKL